MTFTNFPWPKFGSCSHRSIKTSIFNLLLTVFSSITMHNIVCACLFLLKLKPVSDFCYYFSFYNYIFLPSISLFHNSPWPKFHDFPGLKTLIANSMTLQVFHDLYEPCHMQNYIKPSFSSYTHKVTQQQPGESPDCLIFSSNVLHCSYLLL